METNEWVQIVRDLGFPIVVAVWFMLRTDRRQDKMIELLNEIAKKLCKNKGDRS